MKKKTFDETGELMVGKWSVKNPLTLEERKKIKEAIDMDMSYSKMAIYVGRYKSTVMRESKRLGNVNDYDPEKAQLAFEQGQIEKYQRIRETLRRKRVRKTDVVESVFKDSESQLKHHNQS